jgi:hypothetical protein
MHVHINGGNKLLQSSSLFASYSIFLGQSILWQRRHHTVQTFEQGMVFMIDSIQFTAPGSNVEGSGFNVLKRRPRCCCFGQSVLQHVVDASLFLSFLCLHVFAFCVLVDVSVWVFGVVVVDPMFGSLVAAGLAGGDCQQSLFMYLADPFVFNDFQNSIHGILEGGSMTMQSL